jgi:Arc/MetJ-type ribon-helix-helix transcriptional regulator
MARGSTIGVSLTAKELALVRKQVERGGYTSESDVIRDSLRHMFGTNGGPPAAKRGRRSNSQRLAAAYRAMAPHDRKLAGEWSTLDDRWPNK